MVRMVCSFFLGSVYFDLYAKYALLFIIFRIVHLSDFRGTAYNQNLFFSYSSSQHCCYFCVNHKNLIFVYLQ